VFEEQYHEVRASTPPVWSQRDSALEVEEPQRPPHKIPPRRGISRRMSYSRDVLDALSGSKRQA
jgi:hypothetical protein